MIWVFAIAGGGCGVIGMAAGWIGRGVWDKDKELRGRGVYPPHRADELARLPQRDRPLFTKDDWDQLDWLVNGGDR